jgi:hypothetical protein
VIDSQPEYFRQPTLVEENSKSEGGQKVYCFSLLSFKKSQQQLDHLWKSSYSIAIQVGRLVEGHMS